MMSALSGWLQQIVAVVLLASLVDLLLPNRTMQRYVRLVAGLLVLLTVASPVLQLFKGDFGTRLASGLESVRLSPGGTSSETKAEMERIEAEARKLGEARNGQAVKLATAGLAAQIRSSIEEAGLGPVRSVDIEAEPVAGGQGGSGAAANGGYVLSEVKLVLAGEATDSSAEEGGRAIADVEPIAPVDIAVDAEASRGQPPSDVPAEASPADEPAAADAALASRVAALVSTRFGIEADRVRVWVEAPGETDKRG
ncbi:stage III sporulation protein AF [Cohnella xylanilytica]|uniref:Stage III sporulation protein AF n=1 Tax=Cohnella xylanilytica TaxID=557555 RepID=A0A841U4K7_9BACL|nr:stage III sporulation protein AF [Cohnella xylanilytica]MBB6692970.1 stage III sporulation protein AF [Cohnella xylanilytica]